MVDKVKSGLTKLDGKKTAIGAVLLFLVTVAPEVHTLAVQLGVTQEILQYISGAIIAIGAAHKLWKKLYPNGK